MNLSSIVLDFAAPVFVEKLGLEKKNIDTTKVKLTIEDISKGLSQSIGEEKLKKLTSSLKTDDTAAHIVEACKFGFMEIMKDGKIDVNDAPVFVRTIKVISANISKLTKASVDFSIEANELVEICGFFLKSVISLMIEDEANRKLAYGLTTSAIELICFQVEGKKISKSLCCCS